MAQALHEAGASVVLLDILDMVEESAREMGSTGAPVYAVKADLSKPETLEGAYNECLEKLGGRLDILLNGAGIQYRCPAVDFPADKWQKIMDINLSAVFYMSQLAGRTMLKQEYGRIINVASMTVYFASVLIPAYSASKAGVAQLTKALSNELSLIHISGNVNATRLGPLPTGAGGFVDITTNAKHVVFCSTFTGKGLKCSFDGQQLHIDQEGGLIKMVDHVTQVSYNGTIARRKKQKVHFVTERAVFELREEGVVLTEIAPGIDLQTQILDLMEFAPIISRDLKQMDQRLFCENGPFGLKELLK